MTPRRYQKLRTVLARRQPDLTVLMDNVHKPHNLAAVLRSCDAVGAMEIHAVSHGRRLRTAHLTSGGSAGWVPVVTHTGIVEAVDALHRDGFTVVAAHPGECSVEHTEYDFTTPTAIMLGAELDGVSEAGLAAADRHVRIPMHGMVASLNVSVAAAILLFEAARQREKAGYYARTRLEPAHFDRILFEWAQPKVADWCRRHGHGYPALDEAGEVDAPPGWREALEGTDDAD